MCLHRAHIGTCVKRHRIKSHVIVSYFCFPIFSLLFFFCPFLLCCSSRFIKAAACARAHFKNREKHTDAKAESNLKIMLFYCCLPLVLLLLQPLNSNIEFFQVENANYSRPDRLPKSQWPKRVWKHFRAELSWAEVWARRAKEANEKQMKKKKCGKVYLELMRTKRAKSEGKKNVLIKYLCTYVNMARSSSATRAKLQKWAKQTSCVNYWSNDGCTDMIQWICKCGQNVFYDIMQPSK